MVVMMTIVMDQSRVSNRVVGRLAITVTGVHSLLTDRPHNPPLLRTPFVSCLLKIVVLQFFIGL